MDGHHANPAKPYKFSKPCPMDNCDCECHNVKKETRKKSVKRK